MKIFYAKRNTFRKGTQMHYGMGTLIAAEKNPDERYWAELPQGQSVEAPIAAAKAEEVKAPKKTKKAISEQRASAQ